MLGGFYDENFFRFYKSKEGIFFLWVSDLIDTVLAFI